MAEEDENSALPPYDVTTRSTKFELFRYLFVNFPDISIHNWLSVGSLVGGLGEPHERCCNYIHISETCEEQGLGPDDEHPRGCLCMFTRSCEVKGAEDTDFHYHCACGEAIRHPHYIMAERASGERVTVVIGSKCIDRFGIERMCTLCKGRRMRGTKHEHGLCQACDTDLKGEGIEICLLRPTHVFDDSVATFVDEQRALGAAGRRAFREKLLRIPAGVRTDEYPKSWVDTSSPDFLKTMKTADALFKRIDLLQQISARRCEEERRLIEKERMVRRRIQEAVEARRREMYAPEREFIRTTKAAAPAPTAAVAAAAVGHHPVCTWAKDHQGKWALRCTTGAVLSPGMTVVARRHSGDTELKVLTQRLPNGLWECTSIRDAGAPTAPRHTPAPVRRRFEINCDDLADVVSLAVPFVENDPVRAHIRLHYEARWVEEKREWQMHICHARDLVAYLRAHGFCVY